MENANIWIKVDDLDKWNQLENKSEFVSNALNKTNKVVFADTPKNDIAAAKGLGDIRNEPEFKNVSFDKGLTSKPKIPPGIHAYKTCSHGFNPKLCKYKPANGDCK